ncbi:MAG: sugar O-acetyltransferase, partial [Lacticaseibacillus paracasei]|nr:sugar O-acetyltransferase [Lacticaseibacillus paracasei]
MEALTNMESMKQRILAGKLYKANYQEISVDSPRCSDLV